MDVSRPRSVFGALFALNVKGKNRIEEEVRLNIRLPTRSAMFLGFMSII